MTISRRALAPGLAGLAFVAAAITVWSAVTTTSATVSASTDNRSSLFATGSIDLAVDTGDEGSVQQLLFDTDGLYPGLVLENCVTVSYRGSRSANLRLHGYRDGLGGLDPYLDVVFEVGQGGGSGSCDGFQASRQLFAGTLEDLWAAHPDYASGIDVLTDAGDGASLTVRARAELRDDDRAQGLMSTFWIRLEARP